MNIVNIDIILNILYHCEVKDVCNLSLLNKRLFWICTDNKNNIIRNILKLKGYNNYKNKYIIRKGFIRNFYEIDELLDNTDKNVIESYRLEYYDITRFLLENNKVTNYMYIYQQTMTDTKIAMLLSARHCNTKVLIEVIRFTFIDKSKLNYDLDELKYLSEVSFPLNLNWREHLKDTLIHLTSKFQLNNMDSIGYVISMMTERWDFLIEDLSGKGKVWEILYFDCRLK